MDENIIRTDISQGSPDYIPKKRMPSGAKIALIIISIVQCLVTLSGETTGTKRNACKGGGPFVQGLFATVHPFGVFAIQLLLYLPVLQHAGNLVLHELGKGYANLMHRMALWGGMHLNDTLHAIEHAGERGYRF